MLMNVKPTSRYFWVRYSLAVILFFFLLAVTELSDVKVGPWLLFFLGLRSIEEPVQILWLAKKGKFDDWSYVRKRNRFDVIIGTLVIAGILLLYCLISNHLFTIGVLTAQVLLILGVFVAIDNGYLFFTFYRLKQRKESLA